MNGGLLRIFNASKPLSNTVDGTVKVNIVPIVIILKPLQNHDFSKIAKLVKNYTKKIVLAIFKFASKLVKRYPKLTFSLFSKLPKNYTKIRNKIQNCTASRCSWY